MWLAQEPGSLNLKAGASQVGGGEGNIGGKSLRVAEMKMGNSQTLMEAEREVRGAEKPEDRSRLLWASCLHVPFSSPVL